MTYGTILSELNVAPRHAAHDGVDGVVANSELLRQRVQVSATVSSATATDSASANITHGGICQFRCAAIFARTRLQFIAPATLRIAIRAVLSGRADEQVPRVYARWIVATMKHVQAVWDRAIHQFPDKAMHVLTTYAPVSTDCASPWPFHASVIHHRSDEYTR